MTRRKVIIGLHSDEDFNDIIEEFKKESDRACVILSAAKLDAQLYLLLSKVFKPALSNNDELLDGDSPLGTFSSKINIAYRLGLIDSHFTKALHLIRRIRNAFAHEFKTMSLATGGHADRIRELVVHFKDYAEYHDFKENHFGKASGLNIDFKIIVTIAIIRLDTAIHYAEQISEEGTAFIPPVFKRVLRASDQKKKTESKKPAKKASQRKKPEQAQ
ncbi:hypothetical protein ACFFGQ_20980 [Rufibacter quisquiliarum]|uniref:hypothetical protein n=1 Tax=Rufibacter quisquiliarum TaxID=1549639 RepID=UPI0035E5ECAB